MAKKTNKQSKSFWKSTSRAPSAVSLAMGFLIVLDGIVFPSITSLLLEIAGLVLILSGIIGIYLLGGSK